MIDIDKLRQALGAVQPEEVEELLDRLEAAEKERNDFAQQLVQSEIGKREISEARDALQVEVGKLKSLEVSRCVKINGYIVDNARLAEEVERMQAKIAEMERQEPVAWRLVPIEPTQEIRDAWTSHMHESFRVAYQAMLEAAQGTKS